MRMILVLPCFFFVFCFRLLPVDFDVDVDDLFFPFFFSMMMIIIFTTNNTDEKQTTNENHRIFFSLLQYRVWSQSFWLIEKFFFCFIHHHRRCCWTINFNDVAVEEKEEGEKGDGFRCPIRFIFSSLYPLMIVFVVRWKWGEKNWTMMMVS